VIQDPTSAVICVWQAKGHGGFGVVSEVGAYCWAELNTRGTDKAAEFYRGLFDWGVKSSQFGTGTYTEFQSGEKSIAGMMEIQPEWGPVPPHWLVYYQVENCDASVSKAQELGAQVLVPGTDIPGVGRFSVLRDPQGAVLGIVD
jgi:predicted enzyme related to lactoylglutathione lyase